MTSHVPIKTRYKVGSLAAPQTTIERVAMMEGPGGYYVSAFLERNPFFDAVARCAAPSSCPLGQYRWAGELCCAPDPLRVERSWKKE